MAEKGLIRMNPQGHLVFGQGLGAAAESLAAGAGWGKVARAFERSSEEGLIALAVQGGLGSDPALVYWRKFAERFLEGLGRLAAMDEELERLQPPGEEELALLAASAPPMMGSEYLTGSVLGEIWQSLRQFVEHERGEGGLSLGDWLKKRAPQWHQLGRVCFHLAENKNDPEFPFAFMATYATRVSKAGRVQFLPLGQALREYAGAKNRVRLAQLLEPVHEASKRLPFVEDLVATGDLYHPLAWTASEAHVFLRSIPAIEECGLLTRLPNWWKARPRARVSVTIDEKRGSSVGMNAMLSFRAEVAAGGKPLSSEEVDALLRSGEGLVKLNGQWVEVDREKLEQALEHWEKVRAEAEEGNLTFAEGMRLLAGAGRRLREEGDEAGREEVRRWTAEQPGPGLERLLGMLRQPEAIGQDGSPRGFRGVLRPYQDIGYRWMRLLTSIGLGACLADDMGLGKTVQVIALLQWLAEQRADGGQAEQSPRASLLVLPASLLGNWKSEFARFAPDLKVAFVHPSELGKEEIEEMGGERAGALQQLDVVVTTYGMLARQPWIRRASWNLVVLDEAQAIKNPGAGQTRAVKSLRGRARIALTGTPIENRLSDLWSLFDFLCPGLLGTGSEFKAFAQTLSRSGDGYAPLRRLVAPYILRRLKTDRSIISDLPEKTELKAYCRLGRKQAALYQRAVDELKRSLKDAEGMQRRGLVLTYLMRFKQICNHPSQSLGDNDYSPEASGKFERLRELCEEIAARQEKALVFTQFREMTDPLAEALAEIFGRPGLVLHGGTPVARRKALVDDFQREEGPPFFVLSLKAGGTGLTLTAASHVIHFDRWWNPAVENQATDRAFRIGQRRNVLAHKFVCRGTIEEKIDRLIEEKLALSEDLLGGEGEVNLTEMSDDELIDLVSLDLAGAR